MLLGHLTAVTVHAATLPLAATLLSNLVLLLVLVVLFFALALGFFTYAGSGISSHPMAREGDAPGSRAADEFSAFAARNPEPHDLTQRAAGVYELNGFPPNAFNVYLIVADPGERVLLDAGTRFSTRRILREVHGLPLSVLVLTHAHADHQGSAKAICQMKDIPLWCGERDAEAAASGDLTRLLPDRPMARRLARFLAGPAHPVARRLRGGDAVAGFVVVETPGVSPGHISLWRQADRVLLAGDVLVNQHPVLGRPGLHEPPAPFTYDTAENRRSLKKLASLEPALILFGHGPPLRDTRRFVELAAQLG
jgi:hydroxyacylglutathione hydrolase